MHITIYHNPRCRKSRETLTLIEEAGIEPTIVKYLENPPLQKELEQIAKLLDVPPIEFTRTKEAAFKEAGLTKESSEKEILDAMMDYPILIERPIVVRDGKRAIIGRPPELVKSLLS